MFIQRDLYIQNIVEHFKIHPIVGLLGPRQSGKTTIAKEFCKNCNKWVNYFDLEDPEDFQRLQTPKLTLSQLSGLIVIDEIQRLPDLFPYLRVLADNKRDEQQYLILGSASRELINQSSESLAGRIGYIEVNPFSLSEVSDERKLFQRGGFPKAYLANSQREAFLWIENYIRTFVERDLPAFGINTSPVVWRRFWMMLAHYHGNVCNSSEISRSIGVGDKTINNYIDLLTGTFMVRQLQPWHENISKRQVKRPKIYLRDNGILHYLLNIHDENSLLGHPKLGSSWEGFALEQIIRIHNVSQENCYFWGIHGQGELDLLILHNGKKIGFEFKYADAPKITKSITISMETLRLDELKIVYPGNNSYPLADNIHVTSLSDVFRVSQ